MHTGQVVAEVGAKVAQWSPDPADAVGAMESLLGELSFYGEPVGSVDMWRFSVSRPQVIGGVTSVHVTDNLGHTFSAMERVTL